MIHIVHWESGKAEGTVEHDGWSNQVIAKREAKKILAEGYGLTKAHIKEIETYGGKNNRGKNIQELGRTKDSRSEGSGGTA